MSKNVAVLMGGWSAEREVSLVSGRECGKALEAAGYRVTLVDVERDPVKLIAALTPRPDAVFNALHGRGGEDGTIQGVLEMLRLPYTHSGVLASALAMDKPQAKHVLAAAGIPCPEGRVVKRAAFLAEGSPLPKPYVIKPTNEGSSVGVRVVKNGSTPNFSEENWPYGEEVLVERYIPGREITVAVMGDRPLAVTEIRPREGFYDYRAKYTDGQAVHLCPAPLPKPIYDQAMDFALRAHQALGCRGVSRADLRYDDTKGEPGQLYMLEVNTQPGMTPLSLVPEIARHCGIEFPELVAWMVENARCDS
ncbi:MAG: D-alanine--D-alanine ligase [Alphaproteobacteria bacterium]|nr:D-alanine--D-alanine ligase [Alphaproteobacteria bacterium]